MRFYDRTRGINPFDLIFGKNIGRIGYMAIAEQETRLFEPGFLNTDCVEIDPDQGLVRKRISHLPDFTGGLNTLPDARDYENYVGRSIKFLKNPRWGLQDMIPPCEVRVLPSNKTTSGFECWVDMKLIRGQYLSRMERVPENIASQLEFFLKGCVQMAIAAKEEARSVIIPDLLGGIQSPTDRFRNFIIDSEGKLHFDGVYPLAEFGGITDASKRSRYRKSLRAAGNHVNNPDVSLRTHHLILLLK